MMYDHFAAVYDSLMDQVPYEAWCGYIRKTLCSYGIRDGLVLDLGCGTGSAARILSGMGYDMIGVDGSEEMLMTAREKMSPSEAEKILLLNQDMREFELYGTVRAVVSMCDTLNYCESPEELLQVFRLVNNYLDPGGLFLFDLNTAYKYREVLGDNVFAASQEDCAYIWENAWFEDEQVNQYDLTLFIKNSFETENTKHAKDIEATENTENTEAKEEVKNTEEAEDTKDKEYIENTEETEDAEITEETIDSNDGGDSETFLRHQELHIQRAFSDAEVKDLLAMAGLEFIRSVEAYTDDAPGKTSQRILYIAREHMKK